MTRPIDEPWANLPPPKEKVDWDKIIDAEDDDAAARQTIDGDRAIGTESEAEGPAQTAADVPPAMPDDDRPG
jgi:hypothetical protein